MKKINSIYIVTIGLLILLLFMYNRIKTDSAFFYGFSENKETEISHNKDVLIEKISVTTGQEVKQGDLLMVVKNTVLPVKINELELKKEVININTIQDVKEIKYKISDLRITKLNKLNEITAKINELNKEIELNKLLYESLKSIEHKQNLSKTANQIQVDYLTERMSTVAQNYDQEIAFRQELLKSISKPAQIERDILDTEINNYKDEQKRLFIYAPSDGIVGNILCKEKENISAFTTLMNFYQMKPTLVKGYVHESLLLHVTVGDKFEVSSSMHPEHKVTGKVIGLGSRIVEIPQRLRKMPDYKTYGREVLIRISPNNKFLQKERVMLKSIND